MTERPARGGQVADVVHQNGCHVYLQLWAIGRAARPEVVKRWDPDFEQVGPSAIAISTHPENVPRELTCEGERPTR